MKLPNSYTTKAGVELTPKQVVLVNSFRRLMNRWDENIEINAIAGNLTLMLSGDTEQNGFPNSEKGLTISSGDGFNPQNVIGNFSFSKIKSDGGDW